MRSRSRRTTARGSGGSVAEPCIHDLDPVSCAVCNDTEKRAGYGEEGRLRGLTGFEARRHAAEAAWRDGLRPEQRAVLAAHEAGDLVLG